MAGTESRGADVPTRPAEWQGPIVVDDDRFSFMVVEETLPTLTIAEYRRSRPARTSRRIQRIRALVAARHRRV